MHIEKDTKDLPYVFDIKTNTILINSGSIMSFVEKAVRFNIFKNTLKKRTIWSKHNAQSVKREICLQYINLRKENFKMLLFNFHKEFETILRLNIERELWIHYVLLKHRPKLQQK